MQSIPAETPMTMQRLEFTGHSGDTIAARLDLPRGRARAGVLFAHCFTCSKDVLAARRIAARLTAEGMAVLRFDFTGLGASGGEFANTGFTSNIQDLVLAAEEMERRGYPANLLVGHSLGGAAVLAAARRIPASRAVATIGAPADPAHVLTKLEGSLEQIRAEGQAEVTLGGRQFTISRQFVEDVEAAALSEAIAWLHRALLVLHAPRDATVGIANASKIFLAAKHPKSFVTLDDADHLLTDEADADYAASVISTWSRRYLVLAEEPAPAGAPEGVVRVSEADPDGFLQDVMSGPKHHLNADEPAEYGGTDLGPGPYQLVAAGLGACTAITIRMYARRKGWPLDHVAVDITHHKMHARDCADCETREGRIDRFKRAIRLDGALDAQQRARILEIADRCPVHRTLEGEIKIETVEVEE